MTDDQARAGDFRRAALLTKYRRQGNTSGEAAIAQDANEAGRVRELVTAILNLHKALLIHLRTPDGIQCLGDYVDGIAGAPGHDTATTDVTRAAQIVNWHGKGQPHSVDAVLDEAHADGRLTHTVLAVLDLYAHAAPELSGRLGIAYIEANAAACRDAEFNPDV